MVLPRGASSFLQFVVVVFLDHTHLLFVLFRRHLTEIVQLSFTFSSITLDCVISCPYSLVMQCQEGLRDSNTKTITCADKMDV